MRIGGNSGFNPFQGLHRTSFALTGALLLQSLSGLAQDELRAEGEGADRVGTETASR